MDINVSGLYQSLYSGWSSYLKSRQATEGQQKSTGVTGQTPSPVAAETGKSDTAKSVSGYSYEVDRFLIQVKAQLESYKSVTSSQKSATSVVAHSALQLGEYSITEMERMTSHANDEISQLDTGKFSQLQKQLKENVERYQKYVGAGGESNNIQQKLKELGIFELNPSKNSFNMSTAMGVLDTAGGVISQELHRYGNAKKLEAAYAQTTNSTSNTSSSTNDGNTVSFKRQVPTVSKGTASEVAHSAIRLGDYSIAEMERMTSHASEGVSQLDKGKFSQLQKQLKENMQNYQKYVAARGESSNIQEKLKELGVFELNPSKKSFNMNTAMGVLDTAGGFISQELHKYGNAKKLATVYAQTTNSTSNTSSGTSDGNTVSFKREAPTVSRGTASEVAHSALRLGDYSIAEMERMTSHASEGVSQLDKGKFSQLQKQLKENVESYQKYASAGGESNNIQQKLKELGIFELNPSKKSFNMNTAMGVLDTAGGLISQELHRYGNAKKLETAYAQMVNSTSNASSSANDVSAVSFKREAPKVSRGTASEVAHSALRLGDYSIAEMERMTSHASEGVSQLDKGKFSQLQKQLKENVESYQKYASAGGESNNIQQKLKELGIFELNPSKKSFNMNTAMGVLDTAGGFISQELHRYGNAKKLAAAYA